MLTKTKIEYLDYAWNFYQGCLNYEQGYCPLKRCWARGMARFRGGGFKPHLITERLLDPLTTKHKPSRIGVCFTGDLFGDWIDEGQGRGEFGEDEHGYFTLKGRVYDTIEKCPQDTFIFLTKRADRLKVWSPFPANCQVGVSVWDRITFQQANNIFNQRIAPVQFISLEPLLSWGKPYPVSLSRCLSPNLDGLIIGQMTPVRASTMPKLSWLREIVEAADKVEIPVWLKDNLESVIKQELYQVDKWAVSPNTGNLRQELP